MERHKPTGEPGRTNGRARGTRTLAPDEPLAAFTRHYAATLGFTNELREARCRHTDHFTDRLTETVDAFRPLFAPWNAEILFTLYMHGPQRFNVLKRALEGISSRVLTDKLRHLADEGHLVRSENGDGAVSYALSQSGERVARLLHPLVFYLHNAERVDAQQERGPGASRAPTSTRAPASAE